MKIRADRKLHLCYGFIIAVLGLFGSAFFTDNIWYSILLAFICSFLAGLSKEVYDRLKPYGTRKFDAVDWWYTVVGGALFVALMLLIRGLDYLIYWLF